MPAVLQQQTLREPANFEGVGLHSGNPVRMSFLPAPANAGIRFRRVDLEGSPEVEARVENVSDTTRSTTLSKGNIKIHTVEHLLATFAGFGLDNVIVELDANEPPVADGSARAYCKMVEAAGIARLAEKRAPYRVLAPIDLELADSTMCVFPHDRLKITCTSADKRGRFTQFFSLEISPETWQRELAHARTFCFYEEIEFLIKNGLIKGGSLENAVVIRDDAVLTTEPLRYPEEFVRHKMLDILGDLALVGRPVVGHIIAIKPSHAANCELARQIVDQMRRPLVAAQTFSPPPPLTRTPSATGPAALSESAADGDGALDIGQIVQIIPHRFPFLMVDRIIKIEGNRVIGVKNVSINEPYFAGHFPNHPIMPGVLQLEAIAQVAGILMLRQTEYIGKLAYFMSAESVKWRKPVRPGDSVVIDVVLTKMRGKIGRAKGVCSVNDELVSEAEVTFMVVDREES
jgi:UDP-3-O-[3-hydroxymyristoyl] N-acetylglucosamine deacetylase/3-hydroxyacyl-[acyl-carrier-protein] dehydratase